MLTTNHTNKTCKCKDKISNINHVSNYVRIPQNHKYAVIYVELLFLNSPQLI